MEGEAQVAPSFFTFLEKEKKIVTQLNPSFPDAVVLRLTHGGVGYNLVVTNPGDFPITSDALLQGPLLKNGTCTLQTQYISVFRSGGVYAIFKHILRSLIHYYSSQVRNMEELFEYPEIFRDCVDAIRNPIGHTYATTHGCLFPFESTTLAFYKCSFIQFIGGTYSVNADADPLVLLISCLSYDSAFTTKYLNFVEENKQDLIQSAVPYSYGKDNNFLIPEDICIAVTCLLLSAIAKGGLEAHWGEFCNRRLAALRAMYGTSEGFRVNVPHRVAFALTEKVKNLPKFLPFMYKVYKEIDHFEDRKFIDHIVVLSQYKGMAQYKAIIDFLSRPPSMAHFRYINVDELILFNRKKAELTEKDVPLLFFQELSSIPVSTSFPKLGSLAVAVAQLEQPTLGNLQMRVKIRYPDLEHLLTQTFTAATNLTNIAKEFNITREAAEVINRTLVQQGLGRINLEELD